MQKSCNLPENIYHVYNFACTTAPTYSGCRMIIQSKNIEVNNSESEKQALEERFQTDTNQPWDLQKNIASLRFELQALKESNRILEDQIQNDASINTDLTTQLTETKLKEAYHKILALEVELKSKYHYCEELDTMC
ncbi:hypothetical protein QL285_068000 [Trifolium repens]|nr:hypothetical protein QL285_068000 [Trifolium repens]